MYHVINLIRIRHWIKNFLLFIPAFFAGLISDPNVIWTLVIGFFSFSIVVSSVYILNDLRDREIDKLHPEKKKRPFASGDISPRFGYLLFVFFSITGLTFSFLININSFYLTLLYFILNVGYSTYLKHISILDILIVAIGFVIRIYLGGVLAEVDVSHWLSIMIFLLAIFLVLGKRRDDIKIYESDGIVVRKTSMNYNQVFIDLCITMVCSIIIVSYIMYCLSPEITSKWNSNLIFLTTIYVMAGVMRYLQLIFVSEKGGDPVKILVNDWFILITILLWGITFSIFIY